MTETSPRTPFLRSVLSDADGIGSTARLCVLLSVVAALLWVTYLIVRHQAIPPLGDLTVFLTSLNASLYGANKIAAVYAAKAAANCCPPPPPPSPAPTETPCQP